MTTHAQTRETSCLARIVVALAVVVGAGLGLGACHLPPRVEIVDPSLPFPVFCVSARARCDLDGPSYYAHDLKLTGRPVEHPHTTPAVVWQIRIPPGETGVALHIRYGTPPLGWTIGAEHQTLEPGVLYRFENLEFIVEPGQIVEVH